MGASVVFSHVSSRWLKWKFACMRTGGKQREDLSIWLQKCWSCTFFSKNVMCNTFIYISNQETIFILEDTGLHYCGQKCGIHPQPWAGRRGTHFQGVLNWRFPTEPAAVPQRGGDTATPLRSHNHSVRQALPHDIRWEIRVLLQVVVP